MRERHAADPVVAFGIFGARAFTAGTLLICLQNLVMYALLFEIPLVLERALRPRRAGDRPAADLPDGRDGVDVLGCRSARGKLGPRALAVTGSLACLGGMAILLSSDLDAAGEVRLPLALLGIGLGLCGPAAQTASLSAIEPGQSGMAAGVSSTMRYLGGVAGIALLGILLDLQGSSAAVLASHRTVVAVFTCVLVVALGCAALLPGRRAVTAGEGTRTSA